MQKEDPMRQQANRTDEVTAAIIDRALRLCGTEGIDSAIRLMEASKLDRGIILRVLSSPRFHR